MRRLILSLLIWAAAGTGYVSGDGAAEGGSSGGVLVEYFYQPGCAECYMVDAQIKPVLQDRYKGLHLLRTWDLTKEENYARFAVYMEKLGIKDNAHVYFVVDGSEVFAGFSAIQDGLFRTVEGKISEGLSHRRQHVPAPETAPSAKQHDAISRRASSMSVVTLALAGLSDGVNPCVMSTMVFLVSVLGLSQAKGRAPWRVGIVFCFASFLTYVAIGLGLLRFLYVLAGFHVAQRLTDYVLIVLMLALAYLSFRDAIRYRASGDAGDVALKMPEGIRRLVNRMLLSGVGKGAEMWAVFMVGATVTALESVCTGQMYVPALAFVVRGGGSAAREWGLLLLYNVMFILPLAGVFVLAQFGIRWTTMLRMEKGGVPAGKILLGTVFVLLAVGMFVLRWRGGGIDFGF